LIDLLKCQGEQAAGTKENNEAKKARLAELRRSAIKLCTLNKEHRALEAVLKKINKGSELEEKLSKISTYLKTFTEAKNACFELSTNMENTYYINIDEEGLYYLLYSDGNIVCVLKLEREFRNYIMKELAIYKEIIWMIVSNALHLRKTDYFKTNLLTKFDAYLALLDLTLGINKEKNSFKNFLRISKLL